MANSKYTSWLIAGAAAVAALFCVSKKGIAGIGKAKGTRVVFRKFPDGEIIALFPDEQWSYDEIASYVHLGQHGGASPELIHELKPAKPKEYKDLLEELVRIGYDDLIVIKGIGATKSSSKKYYVYAGYYENYISSEPMPKPYVLRKTFRSIDRAIEYADSFGDEIIYCDNVKYDLPDYLYEWYQDNGYEFFKY